MGIQKSRSPMFDDANFLATQGSRTPIETLVKCEICSDLDSESLRSAGAKDVCSAVVGGHVNMLC